MSWFPFQSIVIIFFFSSSLTRCLNTRAKKKKVLCYSIELYKSNKRRSNETAVYILQAFLFSRSDDFGLWKKNLDEERRDCLENDVLLSPIFPSYLIFSWNSILHSSLVSQNGRVSFWLMANHHYYHGRVVSSGQPHPIYGAFSIRNSPFNFGQNKTKRKIKRARHRGHPLNR